MMKVCTCYLLFLKKLATIHSAAKPQLKNPSLSPPCKGGDEGVVRLKDSYDPFARGDTGGVLKKLTKKE